MDAVEAESRPHRGQLLDEAVDLPEGLVVGPVGLPAPELVVEVDPAPVAEPVQLLEVVVREAGAAVQAEKRDTVAAADASPPDAASRDVDEALVARSADPTGRAA